MEKSWNGQLAKPFSKKRRGETSQNKKVVILHGQHVFVTSNPRSPPKHSTPVHTTILPSYISQIYSESGSYAKKCEL